MKTKKILSVMIGCMVAMCVTSCLSSDDDNSQQGMTEAEKQQCFNAVRGSYTGWLLYPATNKADVTDVSDTLSVSWEIRTDSTLTIRNFPTRLLAENINYKELKEALLAMPDQDIQCYTGYITSSPVQFLINPVTLEYNVNYGGRDHKVLVAFYINSTYSYGTVNQNTDRLEMQIIEAVIFVDGSRTLYLSKEMPFVLLATDRW